MCGIIGFVDHSKRSDQQILSGMTNIVSHRGPDDSGYWFQENEAYQVGLGHRRLSIIDLSELGRQPFTYEQYRIVFNGEVYNYAEIRSQLETLGHTFVSKTDTEVIVQAFARWGKDCVQRFIGMFSFAIWDDKLKKLTAFRDRVGVKPFYYHIGDCMFMFGSELKSLRSHPNVHFELNVDALPQYFDLGYIPAPSTIYRNTYKLKPGHVLEFNASNQDFTEKAYWSATKYYQKDKLEVPYSDAKSQVHSLMHSAFEYRMVSDVPVGIFLSGGYDSTSVAAILQSNSTSKLNTFTIGFDFGNNEAPFAMEIAKHIGTRHHEVYCTVKEAMAIIPTLPEVYDEPFGDSSAIPTILVSQIARKEVSVALSADGGDEIFAGYTSYPGLRKKLNLVGSIPSTIGTPIGILAQNISKIIPSKRANYAHYFTGFAEALSKIGPERSASLISTMRGIPEFYHKHLYSQEIDLHRLQVSTDARKASELSEIPLIDDLEYYLPDDILTKVDRATMSVSLEGREPLLDHRLIEYVATLPYDFKRKDEKGKILLKDIVHDYVPAQLMDRPKTGFSIPLSEWLRNDLAPVLKSTLSKENVKKHGVLNEVFVESCMKDFLRGSFYYTPLIWKLFVFQLWCDRWL